MKKIDFKKIIQSISRKIKVTRRDIPFLAAIVVFACVFIFAAYKIISEKTERKLEITEYNEIREIAPQEDVPQETEKKLVPRDLSELFAKNPDFVGWIEIPGTEVSYPVVYTPREPQKYLRRNFYGRDSISGVPFIDENGRADSDNLIIYGHNMLNGTMFSDVVQYDDFNYYLEHETLTYQDIDGIKEYEVMATVICDAYDVWYSFHDASDEATFNSWVQKIKSRSKYNTGVTAAYGQKLITLSTCYDRDIGRILVVCVEKEDTDDI